MACEFAIAKKIFENDLDLLVLSIQRLKSLIHDNETVETAPTVIFESIREMRERMWNVNTPHELSFMRSSPGSSQLFENEILIKSYH